MEQQFKAKFTNKKGNVIAEDQEEVLLFIRKEIKQAIKKVRLEKKGNVNIGKGVHSFEDIRRKVEETLESNGYNTAIADLEKKKKQLIKDYD